MKVDRLSLLDTFLLLITAIFIGFLVYIDNMQYYEDIIKKQEA